MSPSEPSTVAIEEAVRHLVAEQTGVRPDRLTSATSLQELGVYGDDMCEFLTLLRRRFGVDMSGYRWYQHTRPEGSNPLWLILPPWWSEMPKIPIRIRDLVDSVCAGAWSIRYTKPPVKRRPDHATWVLMALLALLLLWPLIR